MAKDRWVRVEGVGVVNVPPSIDLSDPDANRKILTAYKRGEIQARETVQPTIPKSILGTLPRVVGDPLEELKYFTGRGPYGEQEQAERASELSYDLDIPVGPGELDAPLARTRAALATAESPMEKVLEVSRQLNLGKDDFRIYKDQKSGKERILIRPPGQEKFLELDSDQLITMSDVAEAAGLGGPAILGAVGSVLAGRGAAAMKGFRGLATRAAGAALGAATGTELESEARRMLGTELTPRDQVLGQAGEEAFYGVLGEGPGEILRVMRKASGRRLISEDLLGINKEAATLFPDEAFGLQYSDASALLTSLNQQASRLDPGSRRAGVDRLEQVSEMIRGQSTKIGAGAELTEANAEALYKQWDKELRTAAAGPLVTGRLEAADAVRDALVSYTDAAEVVKKRLGRSARTLVTKYGTTFNRGLAQRHALIKAHGIQDRTALDPAAAKSAIEASLSLEPGSLSTKQFNEMMQASPELKAIADGTREAISVETPGPELTAALEDFARSDPKLEIAIDQDTGIKMNPFDILMGYRRKFSALGRTATTEVDRHAAESMVSVLDGVMTKPNKPTSAALGPAFQKAVAHEQSVESLLDTMQARLIIKEAADQPEVLVGTLITPSKPHNVRLVKKIFDQTGKSFDDVRSAYTQQLMKNPSGIPGELARWDDVGTKRLLLSEGEEGRMLEFSRNWRRMDSSPIARLLLEGQAYGKQAVQKIIGGSQAELQDFVRHAGGKNSELGKVIRAGVFQEVLDRASVVEQGRYVIKPGLVERGVKTLVDSGKLGVMMTDDDIARLKLLHRIASFLPGDVGVGESLQTASTAAQFLSGDFHKAYLKTKLYGLYGYMMLYPDPGVLRNRVRTAVPRFTLREATKMGPGGRLDLQLFGPYIALAVNDLEEQAAQAPPQGLEEIFGSLIFSSPTQSTGTSNPLTP